MYEICNWSPKSMVEGIATLMLIRGASSTLMVPLLPLLVRVPLSCPSSRPPPHPPPRQPWWSPSLSSFEFPCLVPVSLLPPALTCTLQPPAASALVRIPCLYPSPLEHGSRQWGDRHNSIPLLLLSLELYVTRESHANFPMTIQTVTYMGPAPGGT